jgi:subtilisin family serine protease
MYRSIFSLILKSLVFASLLFSGPAFSQQPEYVPDQIIVKYKSGTDLTDSALSRLDRKYGVSQTRDVFPSVKDLRKLEKSKNTRLQRRATAVLTANKGLERTKLLRFKNKVDVVSAAKEYAANPNVEYAEPNYIASGFQLLPNDPMFNDQYALNNIGQTGGILDADIDAPEAWTRFTGSGDVLVAILDTGIQQDHVDLSSNIYTNPNEIPGNGIDDDGFCYIGNDGANHCTVDDTHGWNFCGHTAEPSYYYSGPPQNYRAHGSHVMGTIAASGNNSIGVTGINWSASVLPVQILCPPWAGGGFGTDSTNMVDASAAIMYAVFSGADIMSHSWGNFIYSQTLYDAFSAADSAGVLSVIAAGNTSSDNDGTTPAYPASFDLPGIVSVAASDSSDNLATFSNYGLVSVDLAAPGANILSTVPPHQYGTMSGTSMAAPHVTGVAALVLGKRRDLTSYEVKNVLLGSVDQKPAFTGKMASNGRLNADRAVQNATNLPLTVSGAINTTAGNSRQNVPVRITDNLGGEWSASTDAAGHYRSPLSLPHNRSYYVQPTDITYNYNPLGRFISLGNEPAFDISFIASAAISGYVKSATGTPLAGISVKIANCCGGVWYATTGPSGFYRTPVNMPLNNTYYVQIVSTTYNSSPYGYFLSLGDTSLTNKDFALSPK